MDSTSKDDSGSSISPMRKDERPNEESHHRSQIEDNAEAPPAKKVRRNNDPRAAGRGKRLFGILNQTLSKAKEENARRDNSDAAKRRADVEARLKDKLERESAEIDAERRLLSETHSCEQDVSRIAEMILGKEAQHKIRRSMKRRLASFLLTKVESKATLTKRRDGFDGDVAPNVPAALGPPHTESNRGTSRISYPVYYLPRVLTTSQEDILDNQEDETDADIAKADAEWEQQRKDLESELEQAKAKLLACRNEHQKLKESNSSTIATPKQ